MDEIQKIVFEIADRCQRRKVPVTDMLAAFVAKVLKPIWRLLCLERSPGNVFVCRAHFCSVPPSSRTCD